MPHAATASRLDPSHRNRTSTAALTDAQLLHHFVHSEADLAEIAFARLVERYGPIVRRVCCDALGCPHEAQDAAQAVFLVLARKARSIRKPESLGPWLHGVAVRVARRAKSEAARRELAERKKAEINHERNTAKSGQPVMDYADLHEEIDRLPEQYRQPIILCYLQGQTQPEAAHTLDWPLGTVQIRLHRGRERLRSGLTRRGAGLIALTGADLTSLRSRVSDNIHPAWARTTAHAAVRFAAGNETAGLVAPPVAGLAESVLTAMLGDSLKLVALTVISLLLVAAGTCLTGFWRDDPRQEASRIEPAPAPAPVVNPRPTLSAPIRKALGRPLVEKKPPTSPIVRVALTEHLHDHTTTSTLPPKDQSESSIAPPVSPAPPGPSLSLGAAGRRSQKTPGMGRELFERVWVQNDRRSHGGDGLGPVFNGQSCVGCHNLGGSGGAGAVDKNIEIVTVNDHLGDGTGYFYSFSMDFGAGRFEYRMGGDPQGPSRRQTRADATLLAVIHPGFRDSNSTVLHHYGTDPGYNAARGTVPGRHGAVSIVSSERNPPALFGAGRIDGISDQAIEAAARRRPGGSAQIKGRVSRLKDGRVGRFGWKAQTATLEEFVRAAAAGEMGLEVPGRHQAADPRLPGLVALGLDMDEGECDALTTYVRSLPTPIAVKPAGDKDAAQWKAGETAFKSIGCTGCHTPKLGDVEGIYSDLLLHDMGPLLADAEGYSVFVGERAVANDPPAAGRARLETDAASVREWRTPPLWGIRDSAPYLHDGRATTIAQAIAQHAGQAATAARRYADLSPRRKQQIDAFLLSLVPPAAD